jgi:taurine transport system permease protein
VTAVAVVLAVWFVAGELRLVDPLFLPGPIEVLATTHQLLIEGYRQVPLWQHILVSLGRALFAFLMATLTGVPIGLLMGRSATFNAVLDPFVQFLRPLPKLALIPLVVVWFGIGELSKFVLIYLSTFLTIVVAAAAAVLSVPEGRIRAAQSLGVNQRQLFRHVILPSALPELFTGVRVGIGIGWTTLIAAEMIASSSGLGWMVINASSYLRTDVVMLGILLLGITGYLLDLALVTIQRATIHWMGKG